MVNFGTRLSREKWGPWSAEYIDYDLLKRKIKDILEARAEGGQRSAAEGALKDIFIGIFDEEVEKVLTPPRSSVHSALQVAWSVIIATRCPTGSSLHICVLPDVTSAVAPCSAPEDGVPAARAGAALLCQQSGRARDGLHGCGGLCAQCRWLHFEPARPGAAPARLVFTHCATLAH
jgi:hypothetical protein